jgi:translocation and assembly module TamB
MLRRILLVVLLLLVVVPVGLTAWLLLTESGLNSIAGQLYRLERFGVHIEGVTGTVRGPLSIDRIEVDTRRVRIVATGITAEPLLRATVLQTVAFESLRAEAVEVELRSAEKERESDRPPGFLPPWLRVLAERADIERARFATAGGFEITADRIRGRVEVTHDELTVSDLLLETPDFVAGGRVRLEAGDDLTIDVAANAQLQGERWPAAELVARVGGTPRRLDIDAQLESPGDARAVLTISTGEEGWLIKGRLDAADPRLDSWIAASPVTARDIGLDVTMNAAGFTVDGALTVPEIDSAPIAVAARGQYAERRLTISEARIAPESAPTEVTLTGSALFETGHPVLDLLLDWRQLVWPLNADPLLASPDGTVNVRGDLPYRVDGQARLDVPDQPNADVALAGFVYRERVSLDAFTVAGEPGILTGRGSLEFAEPRHWQFVAEGSGIDLSPWVAALPSQIDFRAALEGSGLDAALTGEARIEKLGGTFRGLPLGGSGAVERTSRGWRAQQLKLSVGANDLAVDGRIEDRVDGHWTLDARDIGALVPHAGGRGRFTGAASGPVDGLRIDASLEAADLRYEGQTIRSLTGNASIDLADDAPSLVKIEALDIGGEAAVVSRLAVNVEGFASDHELSATARLVPLGEDEAPIRIRLRARGSYLEGGWRGSIENFRARLGEDSVLLSLRSPTALALAADRLELEPLCLDIYGAALCTRASWRAGGPWSATGNLDRLPLRFIGDVLPGRPGYGGFVSAQFAANGVGATLQDGTATLELLDGVIRYQPIDGEFEALEFGSGRIDLKATPERLLAEGRLDATEGTFLAADLNLARDPAKTLREQDLTGTIQARSDDTGAITLVVPELDNVEGLLEADFAIFGTLAAPRFDGSLALREGKVELYRFNTLLEDIDFLARLRDRRIDLKGTSKMGEGSLEIDGSLVWRDLEPDGSLQLRGQNLLVADSPELRIVASPDLDFDVTGRAIRATGEVVIPSARIEPRDLGTAASVSEDAKFVGAEPIEEEERRAFDVRTEIRVTLGEDVRIDAVGLTGKLDGSLVTRSGYTDVETGRGEIRVVDGKYEAYGQKLDIARGRLIFDDTTLGDPGLDIQAEKEVSTVTVGLNVRGTLRDPRLSFYSEPSMPQNQILSYLLIGKPIDEAGSSEVATVSSAANSLALSGGGFLASQLGRQIGLEEVAIESTGEDDTALVLGKFLSPRLFVSYGISLTESINTAKLRYTISDSWVLKVEAGEQQSADLEFKIER